MFLKLTSTSNTRSLDIFSLRLHVLPPSHQDCRVLSHLLSIQRHLRRFQVSRTMWWDGVEVARVILVQISAFLITATWDISCLIFWTLYREVLENLTKLFVSTPWSTALARWNERKHMRGVWHYRWKHVNDTSTMAWLDRHYCRLLHLCVLKWSWKNQAFDIFIRREI